MSVMKLYNQDAYSENTLVVHASKSGCCGNEAEFCKFKIEGMITNVSAITLELKDGPKVVAFEAVANTPKEIRKAIAAALKANGYDPYYCDSWKGITAEAEEVCVIGEAVVVSMTIDGTETDFEKSCEMGRACKVRGLLAYDTNAGLLSFDGAAGTQIGTAAGFAAGDAAGVKTALEAALDAQGVNYSLVEVTEDAAYESYVYTIHTVGDVEILVSQEALSPCGCYPTFIFA